MGKPVPDDTRDYRGVLPKFLPSCFSCPFVINTENTQFTASALGLSPPPCPPCARR
jgi:hypothetical protein